MGQSSFNGFLLRAFLTVSIAGSWDCGRSPQETPPEPVESASLSANQLITDIPVEIPSYGLIFLKAQVNDSSPLSFVLDSGASFSFVLNKNVAEALRLKQTGELERSGGAGEGSYNISFTRDLKIDLHGLTLTQQTAAVINLDSLEPLAGRRIDGLVGVDIFRRYVVEIDYIGHKVKLYEPTTYRYGGNGEVLQLALESNYLFTHASVETAPNRTITGKFLLDTGGGLVAVVLTTPFVKSSNILSSLRKTIRDDSLTALGGDVKVIVGRAHSFRLRTLVIPQPIIHLSRNQSGALASAHFDGVIGAELLNKFRVIFDYSRRRLILEPNVTFRQAMEYNRTGISVRANGERFDAFTVHQIIEDSPGSDAGVQKGDVLVRINGRAAHEFTMDSIYKMFKENQSILRLTLSRGNRTVQAQIKPRRLI